MLRKVHWHKYPEVFLHFPLALVAKCVLLARGIQLYFSNVEVDAKKNANVSFSLKRDVKKVQYETKPVKHEI